MIAISAVSLDDSKWLVFANANGGCFLARRLVAQTRWFADLRNAGLPVNLTSEWNQGSPGSCVTTVRG